MADETVSHAALMDSTYRHQRLIYDISRRYFLLGRDHLIANLAPPKGARVLEVACGTGRNLKMIAARHPDCTLYGIDISDQMLRSARAKLGARAVLAQGDACDFDAQALFGTPRFERIVLSYSASMIPDWRGALAMAADHLAPGGQLHVVDFGDQAGLPTWFRTALRGWLARFHVEPRLALPDALAGIAARRGGAAHSVSLFRDYARYSVLTQPRAD